jgi:hypothetical protein
VWTKIKQGRRRIHEKSGLVSYVDASATHLSLDWLGGNRLFGFSRVELAGYPGRNHTLEAASFNGFSGCRDFFGRD